MSSSEQQEFYANVKYKYLNMINEGSKTCEGRFVDLSDVKKIWTKKLEGKTLYFSADDYDETITITKVKRVTYYNGKTLEDSIKNMVLGEGFKSLLPNVNSNEEAIKVYMDIYADKYGSKDNYIMGAFELTVSK